MVPGLSTLVAQDTLVATVTGVAVLAAAVVVRLGRRAGALAPDPTVVPPAPSVLPPAPSRVMATALELPAAGTGAQADDGAVGGATTPAPATLDEFVRENREELLRDAARACFARRLPRDRVDDVFQDAIEALSRSWESARTAEKGPRAFVVGVLRHKAHDARHGRTAGDRTHLGADPLPDAAEGWLSTWTTAEDEAVTHLEIERMFRAVDELPEHQREVVELVKLQELTHREAAAVLGCRPGAVRSALSRAMTTLRTQLTDTEEEAGDDHR